MKTRVQFYLKNAKQRTTSIVATVYVGGDKFRVVTGHVVAPGHWSAARQRVKQGDNLAAIINDDLDRTALAIATIVMELTQSGTLNVANIRERWQASKIVPVAPLNFFDTYAQWIAEAPLVVQTRKNHSVALRHLQRFSKQYEQPIDFDTLTAIVWERLARHLTNVEQMANDSTWNVLKCVKSFVTDSHHKGRHGNESYKSVTKKRLVPRGEADSSLAYLTEEEVARVTALDLSDNPRLGRVRDLFIFLCHTGIRYGDSQTIGPEHRHSDKDGESLRFTTGKNRKRANVALLPEALRIWDSYGGRLPTISNQKGNKYLREVLTLAGLDSEVVEVHFRGTTKIETKRPKHDVCGLHTAKRTWVSLGRARGISFEAMAKSVGNTVETLRVYDTRSQSEAVEEIREGWSEAVG